MTGLIFFIGVISVIIIIPHLGTWIGMRRFK